MCPYLRVGESCFSCTAYIGPFREPSVYEQEYYCNTCCHPGCVWFLSRKKEVVEDKASVSASELDNGQWIEGMLAHSHI